MQLAQNIAHVPFHRLFADHQFVGNSRIGETLGDEAQYLEFAVAQFQEEIGRITPVSTHLPYDSCSDTGMQYRLAMSRFAHRFYQFVWPDIFEYIGERTGT